MLLDVIILTISMTNLRAISLLFAMLLGGPVVAQQGAKPAPSRPKTVEVEVKDPLKQAEMFRRLGAGTVVITMGGDGAILVQDNVRLRAGAYAVPYVDASGGGDAFDAGFICGMLQGKAPEDCLRIASALGASCVRAIGTTPGVFTRRECEAFMNEQKLKIERI